MIVPRVPELLLVEDDPSDVRLLLETLREAGVRVNVNVAWDGQEALEMLRREGRHAPLPRPDAIVLDLNLPRMTGIELLERVRQDPALAPLPVVVLTTSTSPSERDRCLQLGARKFLTKPAGYAKMMEFAGEMASLLKELESARGGPGAK